MANFLSKIGFPQYITVLDDNDITFEVLMEGGEEVLAECEVDKPIHRMVIIELLRREQEETSVKYSNEHLNQFLCKEKLDDIIPILKENCIDGDMILNIDRKVITDALKVIGLTATQIAKIRSRYPKFCSNTPP